MIANSAAGDDLVGKFVCEGSTWQYEDTKGTIVGVGADDPLDAVEAILDDLKSQLGHDHAGAIGYIGYEWGCNLLGVATGNTVSSLRIPDIQFLIYEKLVHPRPDGPKAERIPRREYSRRDFDRLMSTHRVRPHTSKSRYMADVTQIRELIADGDIYQANYTQAFDLVTECGPSDNAANLMSHLSSPYSAYLTFGPSTFSSSGGPDIQFPAATIIAVSPERFWRLRDGVIDSRPIKGTISRADRAEVDAALRHQLLCSRKDRAELLMITDLVRNDLGRVADIGSVRTDALVRIRPTPSVWHLESTVTARLAKERTWIDVMQALVPAGSISGAPKIRALEVLSALELVPRGPYCGAIGWVRANGDADFAVGIRTCVQVGRTIRVHGGGGIVADSDPEAEYYESLVKIAPLLEILSEGESDQHHDRKVTVKENNA